MNIQWFPGHMAKTRRLLSDNLKLVDVIIELLDARIPKSSRNPDLDDILKNKPRVVVLNKYDLADDKICKQWERWFNQKGIPCVFADSLKGKGMNEIKPLLQKAIKEKIDRDKAKGMRVRSIKTMVVGIPNVGKSAFINKIAGKKCAVTGDKPGVTKGKQWVRLNEEVELLDTPGVLWPKFEDIEVGLNLAFTGAVKDEIFDRIEAAGILLERLSKTYPELIKSRYKIDNLEKTGLELLEIAGKKRGCLLPGGEIDFLRVAVIVLDEFRGGKIGRISLEVPSSEPKKEGVKDEQGNKT